MSCLLSAVGETVGVLRPMGETSKSGVSAMFVTEEVGGESGGRCGFPLRGSGRVPSKRLRRGKCVSLGLIAMTWCEGAVGLSLAERLEKITTWRASINHREDSMKLKRKVGKPSKLLICIIMALGLRVMVQVISHAMWFPRTRWATKMLA